VHNPAPLPGPISRLIDEHRQLDRVFAVLESCVYEHTQVKPAILDLLASLTDYVVEFPEQVHHPREEVIAEKLIDRGLTPGERVLVEGTVAEHAELAAFTARIARDVDQLLARKPAASESFVGDVRHYLELQRAHMRREEQLLFPLALRMLSVEDWSDIGKRCPLVADPVSEARLDRYRSIYDLVTGAASVVDNRTE
jgi:hemerythrin-like domain-containing protein